jgi:predicted transcriptional regulator
MKHTLRIKELIAVLKEKPSTVKDIAKKTNLSPQYVSWAFKNLRNAGLVSSKKKKITYEKILTLKRSKTIKLFHLKEQV